MASSSNQKSYFYLEDSTICSAAILKELGVDIFCEEDEVNHHLSINNLKNKVVGPIEFLTLNKDLVSFEYQLANQEMKKERNYQEQKSQIVSNLRKIGSMPTAASSSGAKKFKEKIDNNVFAERVETVLYYCKEGSVFLDIRDSADEWIRLDLKEGERVLLPKDLNHRFAPSLKAYTTLQIGVVLSSDPTKEEVKQREYMNAQLSWLLPHYRSAGCGLDEMLLNGGRNHLVPKTNELIVNLCKQFYELGWVTGTGGSISIRYGNRVYMTPSGVQKERMLPEELYVLDMEGNQLYVPEPLPYRSRLKLTACAPLFFHSYRIRNAGAVIHSHGMECVLATLLCEGQTEFRMTHQEMIKGVIGHNFDSEVVIPIIENTNHEEDLADSLGAAIEAYPNITAVLVRRHGIYIWGPTWEKAKTQAECYHYLFKLALEMHHLGIRQDMKPQPVANMIGSSLSSSISSSSSSSPCCATTSSNTIADKKRKRTNADLESPSSFSASSHGIHTENNSRGKDKCIKAILLDIEGTTTPISFVHDVLFPYAREHVFNYLHQIGLGTVGSNNEKEEILTIIQELAHCQILERQVEIDTNPGEGFNGINTEQKTSPIATSSTNKNNKNNSKKGKNRKSAPMMMEVEETTTNNMEGIQIPQNPDLKNEKDIEPIVNYIFKLMDEDLKVTPLKALQGKIWNLGYKNGNLKGEVYGDIAPAFSEWKNQGYNLYIYSSGSRQAQRLLFQYSTAGDLMPYLTSLFDTKNAGNKREGSSYLEIALTLGLDPNEILFLSDIEEELVAAASVGVECRLAVRPGNGKLKNLPHPNNGKLFPQIQSLNDLKEDPLFEGSN